MFHLRPCCACVSDAVAWATGEPHAQPHTTAWPVRGWQQRGAEVRTGNGRAGRGRMIQTHGCSSCWITQSWPMQGTLPVQPWLLGTAGKASQHALLNMKSAPRGGAVEVRPLHLAAVPAVGEPFRVEVRLGDVEVEGVLLAPVVVVCARVANVTVDDVAGDAVVLVPCTPSFDMSQ